MVRVGARQNQCNIAVKVNQRGGREAVATNTAAVREDNCDPAIVRAVVSKKLAKVCSAALL